MLFSDEKIRADYADFAAADCRQFGSVLSGWRDEETVVRARADEPEAFIEKMLAELPILGWTEFRVDSKEVFACPLGEFLHYYESSGTMSGPVAVPKALDDLAANTINIGEIWCRLLAPADSALILINGPVAPAGYQFEKVMEYLDVLSLRLWVDNVTGDYTRILRLSRELFISTYMGFPSRLLECCISRTGTERPCPDSVNCCSWPSRPARRCYGARSA